MLFVIGDRLICANIGDSRAVLSRGRSPVLLSKDHKPDDPGEKKRIESAGGKVKGGRVNESLACSRAFGDFQYKALSNQLSRELGLTGPVADLIIVKPEIREIQLDYLKDDFVVLGCDGLYDNLSNQEIVDFVHDKMSQMPIAEQDTQKVAEDLVAYAKATNLQKKMESDNISAIIIPITRGVTKLL